MDNQRLILFLGLSLVLMLLFEAWQSKTGAPTDAVNVSGNVSGNVSNNNATSQPNQPDMPQMAAVPDSSAPAQPMSEPATAAPAKSIDLPTKSNKRVQVLTDTLKVELDAMGADIRKVELINYPVSVDQPDQPFVLMNDELPRYFVAQSGLISKQDTPNHNTPYEIEKTEYRLNEGQDELQVTFTWAGKNNVQIDKVFTFKRDAYVINVDYIVKNNDNTPFTAGLYRQLQRTKVSEEGQSSFIYTFMGGVVSTDENKYEKIEFTDMSEWKAPQSYVQGGWAAMLQHYFLAALVPDKDQQHHYYTKAIGDTRFIIGITSQEQVVEPGTEGRFSSQFYIGPKDQHRMETVAKELDRTVDYGVLWILAKPLFITLDWIHSMIGNWGWSIIVLTILIKLVFYKLSEASYKSMARMRKYQPKIAQIRERYGQDRQRMSQAMMDLYKKEKINPLGGCLPMLVQIPVFIALYWVLLESVELRQASFILWFNDLSTKDPYYVLPIIMGATMFFQQKLNPAPMDPMQQKIMMSLPFIFTLFFAFFPSGLVLYWIANNLLSIAQQWYITQKIEKMDA